MEQADQFVPFLTPRMFIGHFRPPFDIWGHER